MADVKVRHYRRRDARAGAKELVTELVTDGSETGQFLKKLEVKRLQRPCFEAIDMRGKVPGECGRYLINDRVFYLDPVSYGIYERGLRESGGVFTQAIYEAIVNGQHTNRAMREAQEREQAVKLRQGAAHDPMQRRGDEGDEEGGDTRDPERKLYNPELVPFGYFKKREEARLQYVTAAEITLDGMNFAGTTRDISVNGLQIVIKGMVIAKVGQIAVVSFSSLQEQHANVQLDGLRYEVVYSEQRGNEHLLRLRKTNSGDMEGFRAFVEGLIERFQRKYKLDVEDDFSSVSALLYERMYTASLMHIPFFIGQNDAGDPQLQAVALTDGNQPLTQFFRNDKEEFDFKVFGLPQRLQRLREHGEYMLILYRAKHEDRNCIHSAADFELADTDGVARLLRLAFEHREHMVVKVTSVGEPLRGIGNKKFEIVTERLEKKSEEAVAQLQKRAEDLLFTSSAYEITDEVKTEWRHRIGSNSELNVDGLYVWVDGVQLALPGFNETARANTEECPPEIVRFGYTERRREDRYLAETAVELIKGRSRFPARTRDISTRGLAVKCDDIQEFKVGDEIHVALISLQKKRPNLDLTKVSYRVVKKIAGDKRMLMLERMRDRNEAQIDDFFRELITKNRGKLAVDVADTRGAAVSRVYEGVLADNLGTVPFFIARNPDGGARISCVGVPEVDGSLARFFRMPDGNYDFRWLSDVRLVIALYQRVGEMAREAMRNHHRPPPIELGAYFYKTLIPNTEQTVLHWATELEFENQQASTEFIGKALDAHDCCFVKVTATYSLELNKVEMDSAIEVIRSQSRHRATKLHEQIMAVAGFGEVFDITSEVRMSRN